MIGDQQRAAFPENIASSGAPRLHRNERSARRHEASSASAAAKRALREHDSILRAYGRDTLNAQARLVVLSLLADGRMDSCEVELLGRQEVLSRLRLSRIDLSQALNDFCVDVSHIPSSGGNYTIPRPQLDQLFDEIGDPSLRRKTLNLMFDVIRSDGKLDPSEAALLWNALDSWGLRVDHLGKASVNLA